jgi:hypothetical protein
MNDSKNTSQPAYTRKPLWIYFVAVLFVLTPILHLMMTLRSAGEVEWWSPASWWLWIQHLNPAPAVISTLLCIAGLSIIFVRRWAWWLGMLALSSLCIYNIVLISYSFSDDPITRVIATIGSIGLLVLLFFSDFKQPFFNKRLRWWESETRYVVRIPVKIQGSEKHALLVDISKSGLYLEPYERKEPLDLGQEITVEINSELQLPCVYSRSTDKGMAYRFAKITKHQARYLKRWMQLLAKDPVRRVR